MSNYCSNPATSVRASPYVWIWLVILLVVMIRSYLHPDKHSVFPIYSNAVAKWMEGKDSYKRTPADGMTDVYRYVPPVTVGLIPFTLLGNAAGGVLWRLVGVGVFLFGAHKFWKCFLDDNIGQRDSIYYWILLMPLSLTSINNGQANTLLVGLLLLATVMLVENKGVYAGVCFAIACVLKIYPLCFVLLLVPWFSLKAWIGFFGTLLMASLLPFTVQNPSYVVGQYESWFLHSSQGNRMDWTLERSYRDAWLVIRAWKIPVTQGTYKVIQGLSFLSMAGVFYCGYWKNLPSRSVCCYGLLVGSLWLLLFGPATESSTYIFASLPLAFGWFQARNQENRKYCWLYYLGVGLFALAILAGLAKRTDLIHALGFHPLGALSLLIFFIFVWIYKLWESRQEIA